MREVNCLRGVFENFFKFNKILCKSRIGIKLAKNLSNYTAKQQKNNQLFLLECVALNERWVNCLREVFKNFSKINKNIYMNPEQNQVSQELEQ